MVKYDAADDVEITAKQRELLTDVYGDASKVPQMWAIYKEVMGYYADGVSAAMDHRLKIAVCTARCFSNVGRRQLGQFDGCPTQRETCARCRRDLLPCRLYVSALVILLTVRCWRSALVQVAKHRSSRQK